MEVRGGHDHFTEVLGRGISEFNRGYYFEAHDILEGLWMETTGRDRLFLQGLIQVSVGFYHLFNKNFKGALSQFTKGLSKLENYLPEHRGVELKEFTSQIKRWKLIAQDALEGRVPEFEPEEAPKIELTHR